MKSCLAGFMTGGVRRDFDEFERGGGSSKWGKRKLNVVHDGNKQSNPTRLNDGAAAKIAILR